MSFVDHLAVIWSENWVDGICTIKKLNKLAEDLVDEHNLKDLWLPNIFIYNIKSYKVIDVLSKLAGLWIDSQKKVLYSQVKKFTAR